MGNTINRRDFVRTGAAAALAAATPRVGFGQAPEVITRAAKPVFLGVASGPCLLTAT